MNELLAPRSYLMVPSQNRQMLQRAVSRGADAIVVDLEDSVAADRKDEARAILREVLDSLEGTIFVRINDPEAQDGEIAAADLEACAHRGISGVVVPKVESLGALRDVHRMLNEREARLSESFEVIPLIETPAGVERLHEIVTPEMTRVRRLAFGAGDYTTELAVEWSHRPEQLVYPRSRMAVFSAAVGLDAPIDTGSPLLEDKAAFIEDGQSARLLGFKSKFCIHPRQAAWVHELFAPTDAELNAASRVVRAYEAAQMAEGELVASVDGRMVDLPIVRSAEAMLRRAGRLP